MVTPTHLVSHRNGWEARIYIADSLQRQLESLSYYQRENARSSVAISFREACKKQYPNFRLRFVEWDDLMVQPLANARVAPTTAMTASSARMMAGRPGDVDDECDDCPSCEQGYHERCRGFCPQAIY